MKILNWINSTRNWEHCIYGFFRICKKIEYPELCKFYGKLCILYVRIVWICKKIEHPELRKSDGKLCTLDVRIVCIWRKIEYPELRKFSEKLCTSNVWTVWIWRNLNILNCLNSVGKCIHYMYGFFEFTENLNSADTLNVWNCVN